MTAARFHVSGIVQGVFFRAEAQRKARELGLTGWVRNTDDGAVEIHAEGSEAKLKELDKWCWQGPPKAVVKNVTVTDVSNEGRLSFEIL